MTTVTWDEDFFDLMTAYNAIFAHTRSRSFGGDPTGLAARTARFPVSWPSLYGISDPNAREKIRALTVSKTLALSDIILKLFHVSILRSPEWALSSLPTELANSQTAALKLFKKFTGPFSGLVI